jgi:hypothetical protein
MASFPGNQTPPELIRSVAASATIENFLRQKLLESAMMVF